MRHEPTFHEAILHRDPASEYHFMLYETWESHQDVLDVLLHPEIPAQLARRVTSVARTGAQYFRLAANAL